MAKPRSIAKQEAFFMFLSQMEKEDRSFTMEEIALHTGYPLKGTVKAKISRNEWKNVLVRVGPNEFRARTIAHLKMSEFAQLLSVKKMHEPLSASLSDKLIDKSVQAALSAIELYNKPDFKYREESFAILMVNAWELLLKAKILTAHQQNERSIQEEKDGQVVLSVSGNPRTIGVSKAIGKVTLDRVLKDHLFALIEFRDNAIHLVNMSTMLKLKIQEVGTATLRNYLDLVKDWFSVDLARYNFFLMPMSFFHTQELQSYSINSEPEQHRNLLRFIGKMEAEHHQNESTRFSISLEIRTDFIKGKVRYAPDDPRAIPMRLDSEEAFRKKYRWRYKEDLLPALNSRFSDFKTDKRFYQLKKRFEEDARFSGERYLDWNNPRGTKKRFYCPDILQQFDPHYTKR